MTLGHITTQFQTERVGADGMVTIEEEENRSLSRYVVQRKSSELLGVWPLSVPQVDTAKVGVVLGLVFGVFDGNNYSVQDFLCSLGCLQIETMIMQRVQLGVCVPINQTLGTRLVKGPLFGLLETHRANPVGVELLHINGFVGLLNVPSTSLSDSSDLAILDQYGIGGVVGVTNQGSLSEECGLGHDC